MNTRKFGMIYGAYLGLALIVVSFLEYLFGLDEQKSTIISLLNNFLMIGAIFYAIISCRDKFNNGFISYQNSLKLGTSVAFFASVILAFYNFFFMTITNPDFAINYLYLVEQQTLNSKPEISDEELNLILKVTAKLLQPHWMATIFVLAGTFFGFFYSLIISFFVSKENKNLMI